MQWVIEFTRQYGCAIEVFASLIVALSALGAFWKWRNDVNFRRSTRFQELISKNRIDDPSITAKLLKKVARDSYRLDKVSSDSLSVAMASSFRIIQTYQDELKTLDKEIVRLIGGYDNQYFKILNCIFCIIF